MNTTTGRAKPLSPDERRAAILGAVIPLLVENGAAVTTAAMAEAAGIAEGTIFRVFDDKAALLRAAIGKTMDPAPVQAALAAIDADAPVKTQLLAAADALAGQLESATALMGMLRSMPHDDKPHAETHRVATESMQAVANSLTSIFERHRGSLAIEPSQAAILLRGLIFTNAHHLLASAEGMTTDQLVNVLINGIMAKDGS